HMHIVTAPPRQDTGAQRKRPKYTRSKTGCLTCRAKKIKCDESKPNCMRCTHGQREACSCTWPEGVPARKKPAPRREPATEANGDGRPSTAGSSGLSDTSTPPTRDHTPPSRRDPVELGLPPLVTRRNSEPLLHLPSGNDPNVRRQSLAPGPSNGYPMHPSSHTQLLPAIPEISSSYSAHQYQHVYPHASHNYGSTHSLNLSRHDNGHALRQAESSSSHGQWSHSPMLTTPVDPLEPFFPTVQERNLIRHYCDNSMSIIMAFPSENPILAANLQFVLSRSRGSDSAIESLRTALLGVAAVHQSFLLSRSGMCHGQGGADDVMQLANSFRAKSKRLLYASITPEGAGSDAALGAAVAIALIDIFSGGRGWFKTLHLAKVLVNMRGGPAVLLARSAHPKTGSVTGVSRARLLLEILAVYEIFGCFACREEPTLLSPNTSSWWLDKTNSNDSQSFVEKVFGMSRELILVLARVTCLVARAPQNQSGIQEIPDPDTESVSSTESEDIKDARVLYSELNDWSSRSEDLPDRVRAGNCIYQNAAQIILLRDVLELPPDDTLVQQHAASVLALCLDCGENRMGVDLNWPVIIAGSQMFGADRTRVLDIFEAFRCCYEIETSEHIVLQVWRRLDEKLPRADWRSVMQDLDLNVLIL
ncbi:fungal-specific transcription factor domain-containing protein, partial [Amylocystis lapponica]